MTTFGQLMDPLADKLLVTAALVSLVQMELAPAWMVAIILGLNWVSRCCGAWRTPLV